VDSRGEPGARGQGRGDCLPARAGLTRLKHGFRDAFWSIKGRRYHQSLPSDRPSSVLFVCQGNICRSPFAERLAADLVARQGLAIRCASAGLEASPLASSPPEAVAAARLHGVSLDTHRPVFLTRQIVSAHDVIIAMEPYQVDLLRRRWPDRAGGYFLLSLFAPDEALGAFERLHLVDPFGRAPSEYERCFSRIDSALRRLVGAWSAARP
jgi:protein-tyrosine-phosphatase